MSSKMRTSIGGFYYIYGGYDTHMHGAEKTSLKLVLYFTVCVVL